jgi:hypothetical protein
MTLDPYEVATIGLAAAAAFTSLVAGLYIVPRDLRTLSRVRRGVRWACCASILFLAGVATAGIAVQRHSEMLEAVEARARPLVEAIDAYQRELGRPPERLSNLVPRFLGTVSEFSYAVDDEGYVWLTLPHQSQYSYFEYRPDPSRAGFDGGRWALVND